MKQFTERFIKIPIVVFNKQIAELTGVESGERSWMKFLPLEIESYRPSFDDDDNETTIVNIVFKSGENILAYISPEDFEDLLNLHG